LYWRLVREVPAAPLLAMRVLFSAVLLILLVGLLGRWTRLRHHLKRRTLTVFFLAAVLIGTNWFVFLYSVLSDRVVEAALGYFINPLVNVALGTLVLAERPRRLQWFAIVLATIGVAWFAASGAGLPWISLVLAGSFGLYGLVRKTAPAGALEGSALEMLFLVPIAAISLLFLPAPSRAVLSAWPPQMWVLLASSAVITVTPLLLFARAARALPLSSIGFLQYLAPTCQFLLAVFFFSEPFDRGRLVAFVWIWSGLLIFTIDLHLRSSQTRQMLRSTLAQTPAK
jgi:chloramphenicol-sensitive protein RarD